MRRLGEEACCNSPTTPSAAVANVNLRIDDVVAAPHGNGVHTVSCFARARKINRRAIDGYPYLAMFAIEHWMKVAKLSEGPILRGIDRSENIGNTLSSGQINQIYKRLARQVNLEANLIARISGYSFRIGAAQDLLASGASMPAIMQRGGWSKADTVMHHLE